WNAIQLSRCERELLLSKLVHKSAPAEPCQNHRELVFWLKPASQLIEPTQRGSCIGLFNERQRLQNLPQQRFGLAVKCHTCGYLGQFRGRLETPTKPATIRNMLCGCPPAWPCCRVGERRGASLPQPCEESIR